MIVQRKVEFDERQDTYWQDVGIVDDDIDLLGYLKGLNDPLSTEYRAILDPNILYATVTQPTEKEVECYENPSNPSTY